ncbi:hypothetical protein QX776_11170 [Alteromonadaceae bacterium BrNp21-10]|nr:hypothetical protein [Alteromonadaceae bacterium BrNp21-10]
MEIYWHDVIGNIGVGLIVLSYFLLQLGKMSSDKLAYSVTNLIGANFLLISLYFNFNLASVVIEIFWIAISLYGITRYILNKNKQSN